MAGPSPRKPNLSMSVKDWLSHSWGRMRFAAGMPMPRYKLEQGMQYPEILGLRVRQYQAADFEVCRALHDSNAPGRFPDCSAWEFARYLRTVPECYLVIEAGAKIVASGGYLMQHPDRAHFVWGLVHPDYQGLGLGRVMLFSRIAQFPEIEGFTTVTICAVKKSLPYYEALGFDPSEIVWKDTEGNSHPTATLVVNADLIAMSRRYLERARVPIPDLRSLPPNSPLLVAEAAQAYAQVQEAEAEARKKIVEVYEH